MTAAVARDAAEPSRNLELDGLRGIAILLVVIYHLSPGRMFWLWSGVDLFMVLSGFLITRIVLQSQARGTWSLRNFWIRRALRIWPLYFLALLIMIVWLLLREGQEPGLLAQTRGLVSSLFFLQLSDAYFSADPAIVDRYIPHFLHSWSVAAEEQFYVIWPLLALLLARRRALAVTACLGLVALAMLMRHQGFNYMLLLTRCDGLVLGAMLAFLLVPAGVQARPGDAPSSSSRARWIVGLLALAGLPLTLHFLAVGYLPRFASTLLPVHYSWYSPAAISAFALSYAALTAAVITRTLPFLLAPLRLPPLVLVGRYSYAIYLFHVPLQIAMYPLWPGDRYPLVLLWLLAYAALLMLIGYVCRRLLEIPAERFKHRFPL